MKSMKLPKFWRRLVSLICVCALLLAIPLVTVSGDDGAEPTVTIAFHNLAFANQVYILYAVDVANAGSADVKPVMQFWKTTPDLASNQKPDHVLEAAEYRKLKDVKDGKNYYIFAYTDLTAKMMADVIYARACVTVGDETFYSELDDYSICEYAANRLGIIPGVEGSDSEELKNLLRSMLDYGTNAQKYFGYRTDCLANDFYQSFAGESPATPTADLQYTIDGETAKVTKYTGAAKDIVIASRYEGKPVTEIESNAFRDSAIESVVIPGSVEKIGDSAFANCKSLKSVTMTEGLKEICGQAFSECSNLETMKLPVSVEKLGSMVFPDADNLIINYQGTLQQLTDLLSKNTGWNFNGGRKYFLVSDKEGTVEKTE